MVTELKVSEVLGERLDLANVKSDQGHLSFDFEVAVVGHADDVLSVVTLLHAVLDDVHEGLTRLGLRLNFSVLEVTQISFQLFSRDTGV